MTTVFVYGTLRREQVNHWFLDDAIFLGDGTTVEYYTMSGNGFPYIRPASAASYECGHRGKIKGELFRVSPETLRRLDMLEGVPDHYTREIVDILLGEQTVPAHTYIKAGQHTNRLHVPDEDGHLDWAAWRRGGW